MLDSTRLRSFVGVRAPPKTSPGAARELGLTQPALHAQVAKLADELGAPLYRRVGRGLELTSAGLSALRLGQEWLAQSETLQSELAGRAKARPVTLAAGEGAYLYLLGPAIRRFLQKSDTGLRLLTGDRERTLAAVLAGDAELGVAAFDRLPEELRSEPLCSVAQVLVLPKKHRLARAHRLCLTDLDGERLIVPPQGRPQRIEIERALSAARIRWQVAVEATGWELMLHFAKLELGLAIVNGFCRIPAGFVARPLSELAPVRYFMISDPTFSRAAVRLLADTITATLA